MNAQRVLYATDFSPQSEAALGFASTLAADARAVLDIVHVAPARIESHAVAGPYAYVVDEKEYEAEQGKLKHRLLRMRPSSRDVLCEHHLLMGDPTAEVLAHAKRKGADLIVVGSHGRTGLSRMLMGSVAEGIVRGANCPVVVVKHGDPAEQPNAEREEVASS